MSFIILPGGQYAEKGMVLNLPRNIDNIANQVFKIDGNNFCVVNFETGKTVASEVHNIVDPQKLKSALLWLKKNNKLYSDMSFKSCIADGFENYESELASEVENLENISMVNVSYTAPRNQFNFNLNINTTQNVINVPRINEDPVSVYEMQDGEAKAFPWLFPTGKYGYLYPREKK